MKDAVASGIESPLCEQTGCDFLLYTNRGTVGVQRKHFPSDFLASIDDGRLAKECMLMRDNCDFRIIIIEGKGKYRNGRLMIGRRESRWTQEGIRNMLRSLKYQEGMDLEFTGNVKGTATCLKELQKYFDENKHISLCNRPRFNDWSLPSKVWDLLYFYEGLPSSIHSDGRHIGLVKAKQLAGVFKTPPELFKASLEDLLRVPMIGEKTGKSIHKFLGGE